MAKDGVRTIEVPGFFLDVNEVDPKAARRQRQSKTLRQMGCSVCPLGQCKTPHMEPFGEGALGVVIVGEQPGEQEDKVGRAFVGPLGHELRSWLDDFGVDLDGDCVVTNAIQCRGELSSAAVDCCRHRLVRQLREAKPSLILSLGATATSTILDWPSKIGIMRGRLIPSREFGCWVAPVFHPSYILRQEGGGNEFFAERNKEELRCVVQRDLIRAFGRTDDDVGCRFLEEDKGNRAITSVTEAIDILKRFSRSTKRVAFDYETNQLSPYLGEPELMLWSLASKVSEGCSILIPSPMPKAFVEAARAFLSSDVPKVVYNYSFEDSWSRTQFGVSVQNCVSDPMVTAHVLDERKRTKSLDFQCRVHFDTRYKTSVNSKAFEVNSAGIRYSVLDSRYTLLLDRIQRKGLSKDLKAGTALLTQALPVLSEMSFRGIQLNVPFLLKLRGEAESRIEKVERELRKFPAVERAGAVVKGKFNFGSDSHLRTLFYEVMKVKVKGVTASGTKGSVSADTLAAVAEDNEDVADMLPLLKERSEWDHLYSNTIDGFLRLKDDQGRLHPSFNLHIAETYRSSSNDPNFQNVPHHGEIAKRVRRAIVPKLDWLLEVDYSGVEVRLIAAMSGDPSLVGALFDEVDIHRLWTARMYEKEEDEVEKAERQVIKNQFVFPSFYGASPRSISKALGMNEKHVESVQDWFWEEYDGAKAWQDAARETFEERGFVKLASGFRRREPLDLLQVFNTPIQGPAFHVLLFNLCRIAEGMKREGFKSHLIAQIHDSALIDAVDSELEDVISLSNELLEEPPDWLPYEVPWVVEWEIGRNWSAMEEIE